LKGSVKERNRRESEDWQKKERTCLCFWFSDVIEKKEHQKEGIEGKKYYVTSGSLDSIDNT